jgi:chromosome segregation ATPase
MSRRGVTYENVKHAAMTLLSQGIAPSVQKVREILGTGSNTTLAEHLTLWREEQQQKSIVHLPATLPKELIASLEVLWQTAMEHAEKQLSVYKLTLENEQQQFKQMQIEIEKNQAQWQQKLEEIYQQLDTEKNVTQTLRTENAVLVEQVAKNESLLVEQKSQYEERLQRVYTERDAIVSQNNQLQQALKALQEKIDTQTKTHQALLIQQQERQEQSENRWLRLIDQARDETKDSRKKLESLLLQKENEIKNLKQDRTTNQQELYDKKMQLKMTNDQSGRLEKKIKQLEEEKIKMQSVFFNLKKVDSLPHKNNIRKKAANMKI